MPYTIDGSAIDIAEPVLTDGTTYVPLANVAQALGGYVDFDNSTKVAKVEMGSNVILVQSENSTIDINGTTHTLQAPPFIGENQMWVPVRLFEKLGVRLAVNDGHVTLDSI
jgi:trimeric autotransporter adhesin